MILQQVITLTLSLVQSFVYGGDVIGAASTNYLFTPTPIVFETKTSFKQEEVVEEEPIAFEIEYFKDDDLEVGLERVKKEGVGGKLLKTYLVTFWYNEESDKKLIKEERIDPSTELVARGTKVVWRDIETSNGSRKYWKKIENIWATSYDKSCAGCNEWTALGTRLDIGTCAVDPKTIKLWTEIYVPGYGICRALDVGGSIKGNKIDVGFYDLQAQSGEVGWTGSHWTDIYLLDNVETN